MLDTRADISLTSAVPQVDQDCPDGAGAGGFLCHLHTTLMPDPDRGQVAQEASGLQQSLALVAVALALPARFSSQPLSLSLFLFCPHLENLAAPKCL